MIKIWTTDGEINEFEIDGTIDEIGADACLVIDLIYNAISKEDEYAGEFFKKTLREEVAGDFIWQKDLVKENNNSETFNDAVKMMKDIIEEKEACNDKD